MPNVMTKERGRCSLKSFLADSSGPMCRQKSERATLTQLHRTIALSPQATEYSTETRPMLSQIGRSSNLQRKRGL